MVNFKPGDIAKTLDGREVEILKVDAPGQPTIGLWLDSGKTDSWNADGHYCRGGGEHRCDLLPPKQEHACEVCGQSVPAPQKRTREVTVWVNVYSVYETCFNSGEDAINKASKDALAVAVPHTFTLEW